MSRLIAVGDIHAYAQKLEELLQRISPQADDTFVFLGDYIDRGPESSRVIDRLLQLRDEVEKTIFLRGNHEGWFLYALSDEYLKGVWPGGLETIRSYHPETAALIEANSKWGVLREQISIAEFLKSIPPSHLQFFRETKFYHRERGFIFVHASLDPRVPLEKQRKEDLLLGEIIHSNYRGRNALVVGHRSTLKLRADGLPLPYTPEKFNVIGLDTCVYKTGVLTAMDVKTREFWQTEKFTFECSTE